ncbi:alcohol dehydrogenase catalytic domain-containing protein, partial [Pantoea agglomerans]|uniref:alcohol dehydrogenase catalytic domain-containing protein n=1 Tax=Enterobacter agglomerans TaxID=549 RepID=UPI003C7ED495
SGTPPVVSYPRVLGQGICAEVVAPGQDAAGFQPGQRVALLPYISCLRCDACQSGKTNCGEQISVIGVQQDGGFCDYLSVPVSTLLAVDDV